MFSLFIMVYLFCHDEEPAIRFQDGSLPLGHWVPVLALTIGQLVMALRGKRDRGRAIIWKSRA